MRIPSLSSSPYRHNLGLLRSPWSLLQGRLHTRRTVPVCTTSQAAEKGEFGPRKGGAFSPAARVWTFCGHSPPWIGIGRSGCPSPLPPNRTGGSPASGFPVGGSPPRGWADRDRSSAERSHRPSQGHREGLAPPPGVANMSSEAIVGLKPVALATMVPGGTAHRHSHRCRLLRSLHSPSTFLRHLRSLAVTPLPRYYGRSDSCPPHSETLPRNVCSTCGQVSLIHAFSLPTILSPTTGGGSALPRHATHRQVEPRLLPDGNSGLRHCTAGSPPHAGRIEFSFLPYRGDFLRTGRSPPAAPHPVLRRRSCSRLQVTLTWRGLSPLRPNALSGAQCGGLTPPSG